MNKPHFKRKVILIHWFGGRGNHREPWLKKRLEKDHVFLYVPFFPEPFSFNLEEHMQFLEKEILDKIDQDTIIIWKSLWCQLAKLLICKYNLKIKALIEIAPVFHGIKLTRRTKMFLTFVGLHKKFQHYISLPLDNNILKNNIIHHIIYASPNDLIVSYRAISEYYKKNFPGVTLLTPYENMYHFGNPGFDKFPEMLEYIEENYFKKVQNNAFCM